LNVKQFKDLDGRTDFDWCFVANSMRGKLSQLVERVAEMESRLEAQSREFDRRHEELRSQLESELSRLREIVTEVAPLKHVLFPRGQRFQIVTDCEGTLQALQAVEEAPWPGVGCCAIQLFVSDPHNPCQQFYFCDAKLRVLSCAGASKFVLDDPGPVPSYESRLYGNAPHGGPNQSFWFDGECIFGLSRGMVVTIDATHTYRVRMLQCERKPSQKFRLVPIPPDD
jgi:hypothetical protein